MISTFGRVSTTYINLELGFVLRMQFNICSSSKHRALNPDKGWLHRQIAALFLYKYDKTGSLPFDRKRLLPIKTVVVAEAGT